MPETYLECQHCNQYLPEVYRKDHLIIGHGFPGPEFFTEDHFYELNEAQNTVATWSAGQCQALLLRLVGNYPQLMHGEHNFESDGFEITQWISNELQGEEGE